MGETESERDRIRRLVRQAVGRRREPWQQGIVHCQSCGADLDYEYGSIMWNHKDRDLCPECWATEAVARALTANHPAQGD